MRELLCFYWQCIKIAARKNSAFANDWQWLVGYPATAAILWIVGYFYAELSGRIEVTLSIGTLGALGAALVAYIITWCTSFAGRFFSTPMRLYNEQADHNQNLRKELTKLLDAEQAIKQLSDFYHEGKKKYSEYDDFAAWQAKMEAWQNKVERFICDNFSASELHEFRKQGSGFEYTTEWKWDDIEHKEAWIAKAIVSSRIAALNDMVRHSSIGFLPHKQQLLALL